jgi:hypothetical protein
MQDERGETLSDGFFCEYDPAADLLWIGRECACTGPACMHGRGEILDVGRDVVVTMNRRGTPSQFVSSVALLNASRHPLWKTLFYGVESAARKRSKLTMTFPCDWFQEPRA